MVAVLNEIWDAQDKAGIAAALCRAAVGEAGFRAAALLQVEASGTRAWVLGAAPEEVPVDLSTPLQAPAGPEDRWLSEAAASLLSVDPANLRLLPVDGEPAWRGYLALAGEPRAAALLPQLDVWIRHAGLALRRHEETSHLRRRLATLSVMAHLTPALDTTTTLEQVIGSIIREIQVAFPGTRAGIMLYDSESQELVLQWPAFDVDRAVAGEYRLPLTREGNATRVFRTGKPYFSNQAVGDPNIIQYYVNLFNVRNLATIPLEVHGRRIGILHVLNKSTDWVPEEIQLLEALARPIGYGLENARLVAALRQQNATLMSLISLPGALLTALLNDQGIESVGRVLTEHLGRPLLICDAAMQALCARAFPGELPTAPPLFASGENHTREGPAPSRVWTMVRSRDEVLGYIVVCEDDKALEEHEIAMLNQGAAFAALALMHQRRVREVQVQMRGHLLDALIEETAPDEPTLLRRASAMGLDLRSPHWLLALGLAAPQKGADRMEMLYRRLTERSWLRDPGVVIRKGDHLLCLVRADPDDADPEEIVEYARALRERLQAPHPSLDVRIGIGQLCRRAADYAPAYRGAHKALMVARSSTQLDVVTEWSMGFMGLLLESANLEGLREAGRKLLDALLDMEKQGQSVLLETLAAYLDHNGNVREAAAVCHAHVNTVRYRLRRIEQILGRDLENSLDRLELALAVHVLRLTSPGWRGQDAPRA